MRILVSDLKAENSMPKLYISAVNLTDRMKSAPKLRICLPNVEVEQNLPVVKPLLQKASAPNFKKIESRSYLLKISNAQLNLAETDRLPKTLSQKKLRSRLALNKFPRAVDQPHYKFSSIKLPLPQLNFKAIEKLCDKLRSKSCKRQTNKENVLL